MNKFFILIFSFFIAIPVYAVIQDDFVNSTINPDTVQMPKVMSGYDYSSTEIVPVKLQIVDEIKTEKKLYEGQIIKFIVTQDSMYNGKIIVKKNTIVMSKVKTIITNGMNGIPASIIIDDFSIPGIPPEKLSASYEKFGLDLSLLVFPIKWALTPLPPTGSLTNFIKGGHVKIKSKTPIIIYYHPYWN